MAEIETLKYKRFAGDLERKIRLGLLVQGHPIPPICKLEADHEVSRPTVLKGLEILQKKGCLQHHPHRGYFVTDHGRPRPTIGQIGFLTFVQTSETNSYARGMQQVIDKQDRRFALATFSTHGDLDRFQQAIDDMAMLHPAGVVLHSLPEEIRPIRCDALLEAGIPIVLIERSLRNVSCDHVFCSGRDRGKRIAKRIRQRGYRELTMILATRRDNEDIIATIRDELQDVGVTLPESSIHLVEARHGYTAVPDPYIDSRRFVQSMLSSPRPWKTLICTHDFLAVGALRALQATGITVPRDVQVISGERCAVDGISPMKLTTINTHREEQGQLAAELLLRRIEGHTGPPEVHYVAGELIEGETA